MAASLRVLSSRAASQTRRHQKSYNATHADQDARIDATADAFTVPWPPLQASSQSHRKRQTYACIAGYANKLVIAQYQIAQDARRKMQSHIGYGTSINKRGQEEFAMRLHPSTFLASHHERASSLGSRVVSTSSLTTRGIGPG